MIKVSDYIFDFLKSKNLDTVFSVSGGAAAHLLDSTIGKNFTYVCNYHEQACSMAAEGYARIANKPAIVLVSNGPGSSNTITGVLGAYQDSIPMIVLSGQVPVNQSLGTLKNIKLRQLGVQECDIISIIKPITKYAVQVKNPEDIVYHVERAYHEAMSGRRGPVWLDIPLDVQGSYIDLNNLKKFNTNTRTDKLVDLDEIAELINSSKKPLIIVGNGIHLSNTEDLFLRMLSILKIPVVSTWTAKDLMNYRDELFVGNFGLMGERAANFAVQNADLLLILGSRLSIPNIGYQSHLFAPKAQKIMIDIDENELKKPTLKIDRPIKCDLRVFFENFINSAAIRKIQPKWGSWINKNNLLKFKYPTFLPEYKENKNKINSFYFMEVLSSKLTDNNIIVTDMGTSYTCTMQSLQLNGKNRLFTSSACCSMGFGLPGAIGAYFADPSKEIILIAGDGGFQMNIQELQTINHHKIPIKIFLLNNDGYLAISLMQDNLFSGRHVGANSKSGVSNPDFIKLAEAYNFKCVQMNNNTELVEKIDAVLLHDGSVFCEIKMIPNQPLIPRVQSVKDKSGKIISNSIENMFPYLSEEEMKSIMT
jgi:acetolactate synthase I/II/III large subunit